MFKIEIYYEFKEEPDVLTAGSGKEAQEIVSRFLPKASYIIVTHRSGIQQIFVEGLTWISAVNAAACGNPFPY